MKEEEGENTRKSRGGRTHRLHHIKLLAVLHLVDLVDVLHGGLVEGGPFLVQDVVRLGDPSRERKESFTLWSSSRRCRFKCYSAFIKHRSPPKTFYIQGV